MSRFTEEGRTRIYWVKIDPFASGNMFDYTCDPFYWIDFDTLVAPGLTERLRRWERGWWIFRDGLRFARKSTLLAVRVARGVNR